MNWFYLININSQLGEVCHSLASLQVNGGNPCEHKMDPHYADYQRLRVVSTLLPRTLSALDPQLSFPSPP